MLCCVGSDTDKNYAILRNLKIKEFFKLYSPASATYIVVK